MKMHKVSLLAALAAGALLAFTPNVRAQDKGEHAARPEGGPRAGQAGDRLKKLAEELNLTADQKAKVEAAMKEQREAMQAKKDATQEERRAAGKEAREKMNAKMKEILTAEQYAKWEKIREQNRPGGPGGPGGPGQGGPGAGEGKKPRGPKPE